MHPRPTCTTSPISTSASPLSQADNCLVNSPSVAVTLPCLSPTNTSLRTMESPTPRDGSKYEPCAYAATPKSGIATPANNSATSIRRQPFVENLLVTKFLIVYSPSLFNPVHVNVELPSGSHCIHMRPRRALAHTRDGRGETTRALRTARRTDSDTTHLLGMQ